MRSFLDSGISQLAITLLSMVISAAAIFALDWRIGLLMMFMGVPIYYLTRWFQSRATPVYRRMRTESARLTSRFVETFAGIRAVKAFGAEAKLRSEYAQTAESYRVRVMDSVKVFGIYSPVLILLGDVFIAAALVLGGYAVLGGDMQVGTLLALVIYARRVFEPVMQLSEFYNMFQSAMSALEKLSAFLAEKPEVADPENPVSPVLEKTGPAVSSPEDSARGALVSDRCRQVDDCQARGAILRRVLGCCSHRRCGCARPDRCAATPRGAYADAGGVPVLHEYPGEHPHG